LARPSMQGGAPLIRGRYIMGVAATFRWKVADIEEARKWGKIGNEVWTKAGATSARAFLVMVGPNVANWIYVFEFPDLATYERARASVRASAEFKGWTEASKKVGNVLMDAGLIEEIAL
jgi:NIPSNAP